MAVSVPQIGFRYMEYNRGNPFKRTVRRTHLFCKVCEETVLTHCISKLEGTYDYVSPSEPTYCI